MKIPAFRLWKHRKLSSAILLSVVLLLCIGGGGIAIGSSGGEHEGGAKGWIATDTYRVINFAVLAICLFLLLRKPVSQALGGRIKGIKEQLDELEAKKIAAEKQLAEYNEKLKQLDKQAESIIAEYIRQGNEAKARILKEAENSALKLEEQAKRNIEHEFAMAKFKLQEEVMEKAIQKAEEIIKNQIAAEDQERLIDDYLKKVVA